MRKKIQPLIIVCTTIITIIAAIFLIKNYTHKTPPPLFSTERVTTKALSQVVYASGELEIKNPIKLGSIVSGVVKDLYVQENDIVTEGQLLTIIDPGTDETEFEQAYNLFLTAQKEFQYRKNNFLRKTALFKAGQLAQDEFEFIEKDTANAEYTLNSAQAKLTREKILLGERKIYAPQAGVITKVTITLGSGVVGSNVNNSEPLIEIAPDLTTMEIKLNIDENDIGLIKIDQKIKITINAYPDQPVFSTVKDIGFSPKKIDGVQFYKISADLRNPHKHFRPGMFFNAKIYIEENDKARCIQGFAFQVNPKNIEHLAQKLSYNFQPIDKAERKKIKETNNTQRIKFVWVKERQRFVQKAVTIGIIDNNYFEIKEGVTDADEIVVDVCEEDHMHKIYKKWFTGPL